MKKFLMVLTMAALLAPAAAWSKDVVKVGVLSDLSGPTSDVGRPYAEGVKAAGAWLNSQGGVAGKDLELIQVDYAYNVQQALAAYKNFISQGIVALQGWGTGDTEALVQFVAKDKIPTFSASYSAHLTDPAKAPYNFFIAADYSTMMRAGIKYLKDNHKGPAAPKIAFIYPNHPYGLSPIAAGKDYAKELGFEIVAEENVDLKAMDATTQLLAVQKAAPDYCWIGGTTASAAVILKDAKKLGMKTQFFSNIWGLDENLLKLAGDAAEGAIGLQGSASYNDPGPGLDLIRTLTSNEPKMTHFIRGFASMLVMAEGMKRAAAKGPLTGESIKAAVETLKDYDPMGLTPPLTYLPTDHRPNMAAVLFKVQGGKLVKLATSTLDRRADWLGK
ncbi:MAG: ABC transporter substrate-binding protein [Thermodesulfobacteriota bacterium]